MYEIDWMPKARRQIRKLKDRHQQQQIYQAIDGLRRFPHCPGVKALVDHRYGYRLRAGRWRVLFDVETHIRIIQIQEVKPRNDHTY